MDKGEALEVQAEIKGKKEFLRVVNMSDERDKKQ